MAGKQGVIEGLRGGKHDRLPVGLAQWRRCKHAAQLFAKGDQLGCTLERDAQLAAHPSRAALGTLSLMAATTTHRYSLRLQPLHPRNSEYSRS